MGVTISIEKQEDIIRLRARGYSFAKIAKEVDVAKQTAVDTCKKSEERIATLKALYLEELYETEQISKEERIKAHSSLIRKIRDEIEGRDLEGVSTDKLIDLYLKASSTLKEELVEPNFQSTEEQTRDRKERELLDRLTSLQ